MSIAERLDDDSEAADFQLPLLGLYADLETGRGSVALPDDFFRCPAEVQLGLLRDWEQGLVACRRSALARLAEQLAAAAHGGATAEAADRLRAICASLGIDAPPDVAVSLPCK